MPKPKAKWMFKVLMSKRWDLYEGFWSLAAWLHCKEIIKVIMRLANCNFPKNKSLLYWDFLLPLEHIGLHSCILFCDRFVPILCVWVFYCRRLLLVVTGWLVQMSCRCHRWHQTLHTGQPGKLVISGSCLGSCFSPRCSADGEPTNRAIKHLLCQCQKSVTNG